MSENNLIKLIPSKLSKTETEILLNKYQDWFYSFRFTNGAANQFQDTTTGSIHTSRAKLIFPLLDKIYDKKWNSTRCLDIACHQGWFTMQAAIRGTSDIIGLDIRREHIEKANLIKDISGLKNISFKEEDLYNIKADEYEKFDIVFFLGILYHIDDPLGAIRIVRSLTKDICVMETQVARETPYLECAWGSNPLIRKGPGIALVESDDVHAEGTRSISMVPTLDALYKMLYSVGFSRVYLSIPSNEMFEQYRDFDRVVIFAQVDFD
jgi:tRNA (mo5U34)-methyltransferase